MNTLSDLRSTLEEHAERVPDGEAVVRTAAVRHRVSVVRRRRRAVAAGGLALVVATVIGAVGVQRGPRRTPPPRRARGACSRDDHVPGLHLSHRRPGRDLRPPVVDASRVVDRAAPAELDHRPRRRPCACNCPTASDWTSRASGFRDFVVIPPGPAGTLRCPPQRAASEWRRTTLTDAQPDGATPATASRSVVRSRTTPLVAAVIGARDRPRPVRRSSCPGRVADRLLCTGTARRGTRSTSSAAGGVDRGPGGCDHSVDFDPGFGDAASRPGWGLRARPDASGSGSRRSHGSDRRSLAGSAEEVRIGLGLYGPVASGAGAGTRWASTSSTGAILEPRPGHVEGGRPAGHDSSGASSRRPGGQCRCRRIHGLTRIELPRRRDSRDGGRRSRGRGGQHGRLLGARRSRP